MNKNIYDLAYEYATSTGRNIFITGKAGSGKTTFLKKVQNSTYKNCVVAAPTGIAAINAGGVTLHSLFQLPFGAFLPVDTTEHSSSQQAFYSKSSLLQKARISQRKLDVLREMELLIIDEVSMLRADVLDAIDQILRMSRRNPTRLFGGVQVVFFGDLYQLPPVVKDIEWRELQKYYASPFFFDAKCLEHNPPLVMELNKVFRQSNQDFIDLLNRIRTNSSSDEDQQFLNKLVLKEGEAEQLENYIYLTTHNRRADTENERHLNGLTGEPTYYTAIVEDTFPESMYPVPVRMELKVGARVMFTKNDISGQTKYFNGKMATVRDLTPDGPIVDLDGESFLVERYIWENIRYDVNKNSGALEEDIIGTFAQFPLRLAWAITIHKSQGLTFEKAILDVSSTFASGQLYVALSRLTGPEHLRLARPIHLKQPEQHEGVNSFHEAKKAEEELEQDLEHASLDYVVQSVHSVFDFGDVVKKYTIQVKKVLGKNSTVLPKEAVTFIYELQSLLLELDKTGKRFGEQVLRIHNTEEPLVYLKERLQKAVPYFKEEIGKVQLSASRKIVEFKGHTLLKVFLGEVKTISKSLVQNTEAMDRLLRLIGVLEKGEVPTKEQIFVASSKSSKPFSSKVPTAEVSYTLFLELGSLAKVSERRGLVLSTVEGHLAKYVENGQLDIEQLVAPERVFEIKKVFEANPGEDGAAPMLSDIKSLLGESYQYGEIRLVRSYLKSLETA